MTGKRKQRLLLVDDHSSVRVLLSAALKHHGFDVVVAADGDEALRLCRAQSIDMCVSDVDLQPATVEASGMNGYMLLQRLTAECPDVKVLLFSGYSDAMLRALGVPTDHLPVLRKPCDLLTLASHIRTVLAEQPQQPHDAGTAQAQGGT